MSLTPQALRLLSRELIKLRTDPPEGVRVIADEDDLTAMEGLVQGPAGTPYEGGYFRIRFNFGPEYPNVPPKCTMITKIFHPNMSKAGEICVDTLKKGWKKDYGVGHVLVTIKCLLIYPNPESALDEEAGKQLLADYDGYCKYAKLMTSIHATPKLPPIEFRTTVSKASATVSTPNLSHLPVMSSSSRPPNSTSSTTSSSAATATTTATSSTKPAPLQAHARQEQSPVLRSSTRIAGNEEKVLKTASTNKAPSKTAAKGGAKRGLKRL